MTLEEHEALLQRIAVALEAIAAAFATPPAPAEPVCLHPQETRESWAVMGKPDRWICGICKHKNGF